LSLLKQKWLILTWRSSRFLLSLRELHFFGSRKVGKGGHAKCAERYGK